MEVGPVLGSGVDPNAATSIANEELGRDDFLRMLLVQLEMQDPLDPLKNDEMIAQLAQFSSLEQISNMNLALERNLEADLLLGQLLNNTMATTLIGKGVRVSSSSFQKASDESVSLGYRLDADASSVTVSIFDAGGRLVTTIENLEHSEGDHTFEWDGRDSEGNSMPTGSYAFRVAAADNEGGAIAVEEMLIGRVDGIHYQDGIAWLVLGETEALLSTVSEVFDGV